MRDLHTTNVEAAAYLADDGDGDWPDRPSAAELEADERDRREWQARWFRQQRELGRGQ